MTKRLPPLDWIRVFEVAARTGSFAIAADMLAVSPGAVSRSIKELENFTGVDLFRRLARGVELTDNGRDYAERVGPAIAQIAEASERLSRKKHATVLRITAMPALAERWLVPRLGGFHHKHPEISVEFSADSTVVPLAETDFDIALRYGSGRFGDLECEELFKDELFPVLAPSLLAETPVETYDDLFKLPAIQDKNWGSDWKVWLDAAGVSIPQEWHLTSFTLYSMALSAAISGHGVVMGHSVLVDDALRKGMLVAPFELRVRAIKSFYVIRNPNRAASPSVDAFVGWLTNQAAEYNKNPAG